MPVLLLALLFVLLLALIIPLLLYQRFRVGSSRRPARRWLATVNIVAVSISIAMLLAGAAVASSWIPGARTFSLFGLIGGALLGALGVVLTRWEQVGGRWHFTPNRWLVLGITLIVAVRIGYAMIRMLYVATAGSAPAMATAATEVAGSMAAGAIVLGYFLVFWIGVRRRM